MLHRPGLQHMQAPAGWPEHKTLGREERTDLGDPGILQTPGVRKWSAFAATTFYNSFISEISTMLMSGPSRGPSGPDNNLIKAPKCKEIKNKVSPNN